jgi:beta-lactamase class A
VSFTPRREELIAGSPILGALVPSTTPLSGRALATFMIVNSDNTATNLLIERFGMARLNQFLARLGLANIRWRRRMLDMAAVKRGEENTATPRALSELLLKLHRGELAGHAEFFRILGQPKLTYLGTELGEEVPLFNKTGSLPGVIAETCVVRLPQRPFVLSVMTSFSGDARAAERLLAKLGLLSYRAFERLDGSSPLGRRL